MNNKKILQLLAISSFLITPAQRVFAMPDCYVMDTAGKVINLGFLCNVQLTSSEPSPAPPNQTPPANPTQPPTENINQTPQPTNTNQNRPNTTPTNRTTVPTL
ncbi:MAG: hypothetical protein ACXITR_13100 [Cyanobacterium sp.]